MSKLSATATSVLSDFPVSWRADAHEAFVPEEVGITSNPSLPSEGSISVRAAGAASAEIGISARPTDIAAISKLAGRVNAAATSSEDEADLRRQRKELIQKKLNGSITRTEEHFLDFIRWSIECVEDARYGQKTWTISRPD